MLFEVLLCRVWGRLVVMPPAQLWNFTASPTGGVYVQFGAVVLSKYGTVKSLGKVTQKDGKTNDLTIKVHSLCVVW